jgi:hypothetical protein
MPENKTAKKPEHNWLSLIFNVVLPVVILHKLSERLGPTPALLLALSFPLGYGIYDFIQRKKVNPLSLLGFLNVTVTGGLAVLGMGGMWFSLKEAFFPLLIAFFVLGSAFTKKPFIKTVFFNPQLMDLDKIYGILTERSKEADFEQHLRTSTIFLSGSFFLSAVLNFTLALRVFTELDPTLTDTQKSLILNGQIATMTQWSFLVIMVPSLLCLIFILWYLLSGIKKLTSLKIDDFMKS